MNKFFTITMPKDTKGPTNTAKITVPNPTTPPRYQPRAAAKNSIAVLIKKIGSLVTFDKPIFNPSLGPGP